MNKNYFVNNSDVFAQQAGMFDKAKKNIKNMVFAKSNNSVLASIVANMKKENNNGNTDY